MELNISTSFGYSCDGPGRGGYLLGMWSFSVSVFWEVVRAKYLLGMWLYAFITSLGLWYWSVGDYMHSLCCCFSISKLIHIMTLRESFSSSIIIKETFICFLKISIRHWQLKGFYKGGIVSKLWLVLKSWIGDQFYTYRPSSKEKRSKIPQPLYCDVSMLINVKSKHGCYSRMKSNWSLYHVLFPY